MEDFSVGRGLEFGENHPKMKNMADQSAKNSRSEISKEGLRW